ncbi:MAG: anti-sigma factor [Candidatus Dormibacteria bacterium]
MTLHEQVDELIAAYSLGAVDGAEASTVRRHLPECAECQDTLLRMMEVVAVLPLSLEEIDPPKELRDRILSRVAGQDVAPPERGLPASAHVEPQMGKLLFLRRVPNWAPVAAAAVLLAAMFGWNMSLQNRHTTTPSSTEQAALVDNSNSPVGTVTYMKDRQVAFVTFSSLSAPAAGKTYELWLIRAGRAQPAGVFLPDGDGSKVLVLNRAINHGDRVAVTEEAPGGVAQPTGLTVITAQL